MESKRPKDPFAKFTIFALLNKFATGKGGRQLVVNGFELKGNAFDEIDDLAIKQTEVAITIQPSRRGTIYAGQDVKTRIKGEDHSHEVNAIGELVIEVSNAMRGGMLDKYMDEMKGWDDEEMLGEHKANIHKCVQDEEWIDALIRIMVVRNLEKAEVEVVEKSEKEEDTLFDENHPAGELPKGLGEGEKLEPVDGSEPFETEEPTPPTTEDIAEDDVTPDPEDDITSAPDNFDNPDSFDDPDNE
jgi:hypothetical protein